MGQTLMKAWIQQSDLHFEFVGIAEEARLDGIPKITRLALGEVKFKPENKSWAIALTDGRITSFKTLESSMKAVEFLSEQVLR